jgi:predicted nucleotide-binding protein
MDLDEEQLHSIFLNPRREGRPFVTGGQTIDWADVQQIRILHTGPSLEKANARITDPADTTSPEDFLREYGGDVTDQFIVRPPGQLPNQQANGDVRPLLEHPENVQGRLYYNFRVETDDDAKRRWRTFALDLTKEEAKDLVRMCVRQDPIRFQEEWLVPYHDFKNIVVGEDDRTSAVIIAESNWPTVGRHPEPREWWVPNKCRRQVRNKLWSEVVSEMEPTAISENQTAKTVDADPRRVFVVHGRDQTARETVARFLERLGLETVILHEMPNAGRTIIEKIEKYSDVAFAVVLLTPDDVGALKDDSGNLHSRARQNVVLELGYFIAKLGRENVCPLYVEGVELPSDVSGLVYVEMDSGGGWKLKLAKELEETGFSIDRSRIT